MLTNKPDFTKNNLEKSKMSSDNFPNLTHYQKSNKGNLAFVIFGVPKEEINFEEFKTKVSKLKDNDFPLYKELKDSLS